MVLPKSDGIKKLKSVEVEPRRGDNLVKIVEMRDLEAENENGKSGRAGADGVEICMRPLKLAEC